MTRVNRQRGYLLVMTMWMLAAIAIAASYFAERVQKSLQLAQQRQGLSDAQIALSDARAEILFRLSTTPLTQAGLGTEPNAIALDDRVYKLEGSLIQLQDARGLINLNYFADDQMQRVLGTLGVPSERQSTLIDVLRDYTDADDLRRLNGAEAAQYQDQKLPPPRNAPMMSPLELHNLLWWRDLPWLKGLESREALDLFTADQTRILNPNTASWQVLTALPGVNEEIAKAIIARRKIAPISVAQLDQMLGTQLDGMPPQAIAFPADTVRVTHWLNGLPWGLRYNVQLTPQGANTPWQITYFYRLERNVNADLAPDAIDPPDLPPRTDLPATSTLPASN